MHTAVQLRSGAPPVPASLCCGAALVVIGACLSYLFPVDHTHQLEALAFPWSSTICTVQGPHRTRAWVQMVERLSADSRAIRTGVAVAVAAGVRVRQGLGQLQACSLARGGMDYRHGMRRRGPMLGQERRSCAARRSAEQGCWLTECMWTPYAPSQGRASAE